MCISCEFPTTCPADQVKNFGDSFDSSFFFPLHSQFIKKSCQLSVQNVPSTFHHLHQHLQSTLSPPWSKPLPSLARSTAMVF